MRLYAVISDIHANYEALKAVAKDARNKAKQYGNGNVEFVCLGDVVDYGPQPNQCMDWVRQNARIVVEGNHDRDVAAAFLARPETIAQHLWPVTLWTRHVLKDAHKQWINKSWKSVLSNPTGLEGFTLFHSTLQSGHMDYVNNPGVALENTKLMRVNNHALFGHTHHQGYYQDGFNDKGFFEMKAYYALTARQLAQMAPVRSQPDGIQPNWEPVVTDEWIPLLKINKALLNPGSVGQPRRHDVISSVGIGHTPHAAYMLLKLNGGDQGAFMFRQVPYNAQKTVKLMREWMVWPPLNKPISVGHEILPNDNAIDPQRQATLAVLEQMETNLEKVIDGLISKLENDI